MRVHRCLFNAFIGISLFSIFLSGCSTNNNISSSQPIESDSESSFPSNVISSESLSPYYSGILDGLDAGREAGVSNGFDAGYSKGEENIIVPFNDVDDNTYAGGYSYGYYKNYSNNWLLGYIEGYLASHDEIDVNDIIDYLEIHYES